MPVYLKKLLNVPAGKPAGQTVAAQFSKEYPQSILADPSLQHEQSLTLRMPAADRELTHKSSSSCGSLAFYEFFGGVFLVKKTWLLRRSVGHIQAKPDNSMKA